MGVGLDVVSRGLRNCLLFLRKQANFQLIDDGLGDLVLDGEDVGQVAVVAVGPDVPAGYSVNQLPGDPDPLARLSDASLEQIFYPELGRHLLQLDRLSLVREAGVAPDYEQSRDLGQIGDHVFGDSVTEKLLLGVATHIVER